MKQNKTYLHLGVTLVVSACAVLMFYDTFFQSRVLLDFFDKLRTEGVLLPQSSVCRKTNPIHQATAGFRSRKRKTARKSG